jgi:hypothetical protein
MGLMQKKRTPMGGGGNNTDSKFKGGKSAPDIGDLLDRAEDEIEKQDQDKKEPYTGGCGCGW